MSNVVFEDIYIENNVQRVLGIRLQGGILENITIRNVFLTGTNNSFNYLYAESGGVIRNLVFDSIVFNGNCIENHTEFDLQRSGTVQNIVYQGCGQTTNTASLSNSEEDIEILQFERTLQIINKNENFPSLVTIYNIYGKQVFTDVLKDTNSIEFTSPGIYLLSVKSKNHNKVFKVLIK